MVYNDPLYTVGVIVKIAAYAYASTCIAFWSILVMAGGVALAVVMHFLYTA